MGGTTVCKGLIGDDANDALDVLSGWIAIYLGN